MSTATRIWKYTGKAFDEWKQASGCTEMSPREIDIKSILSQDPELRKLKSCNQNQIIKLVGKQPEWLQYWGDNYIPWLHKLTKNGIKMIPQSIWTEFSKISHLLYDLSAYMMTTIGEHIPDFIEIILEPIATLGVDVLGTGVLGIALLLNNLLQNKIQSSPLTSPIKEFSKEVSIISKTPGLIIKSLFKKNIIDVNNNCNNAVKSMSRLTYLIHRGGIKIKDSSKEESIKYNLFVKRKVEESIKSFPNEMRKGHAWERAFIFAKDLFAT